MVIILIGLWLSSIRVNRHLDHEWWFLQHLDHDWGCGPSLIRIFRDWALWGRSSQVISLFCNCFSCKSLLHHVCLTSFRVSSRFVESLIDPFWWKVPEKPRLFHTLDVVQLFLCCPWGYSDLRKSSHEVAPLRHKRGVITVIRSCWTILWRDSLMWFWSSRISWQITLRSTQHNTTEAQKRSKKHTKPNTWTSKV